MLIFLYLLVNILHLAFFVWNLFFFHAWKLLIWTPCTLVWVANNKLVDNFLHILERIATSCNIFWHNNQLKPQIVSWQLVCGPGYSSVGSVDEQCLNTSQFYIICWLPGLPHTLLKQHLTNVFFHNILIPMLMY